MRKLPKRMQDSLYKDIYVPAETIRMRKKFRQFAQNELFPIAYDLGQKTESNENFPFELFKSLAGKGFFKAAFPKKHGGLGLKYPALASAVLSEELAYISASFAGSVNAHYLLSGKSLSFGSRFIVNKYLKPLLNGELFGSFAMTEPQSGSDVRAQTLITKARKRGDRYIVNGQKRYITNAGVADFVSTLVSLNGKACMMAIDLDSKGCTVSEPDKKLGNRGELTYDIYFNNVSVPKENLIGEQGEGLKICVGTLMYGRTGIGANGVGMAQSAFDECVAFMSEREAFGKKLNQFQHWQFLMAERAIEIENARNLYVKSALSLDGGNPFPILESSGAKFYGSKISVDMARDAVQIFGGLGLMVELAHDCSAYKVEEIYRDSKVGEIYEGSNEIHKMVIAREIFGR
ncbi:MAG: acyl-CoA dehydrogenase [Candidatus Dadabacteria bacterium]|nr:acyl-CoA dehydrogenase [Candidatus Dadabacteria bacterium]NIS09594.1 acyl-CoA dehydrogenase [Candidatus Dadabacteria bacterium]NIV43129.1 acyl-CoA dehydrogenase [Candidatus Dadabacteria bacterium]NIX16076.1 acyl-CoA dehydrogenase [Candidatus Dadabacteria bacterium]NIY22771.1 acyl-CoA dehydrogenase [Candidatus Dadabacteria bacterium]